MEKNVLLTTRRGDEVIVIRPYTSIYNVKGLTDYVDNIIQFVKTNYVHKEAGKGLSTNDFTDEHKARLEHLVETNVTEIQINGETITNDNGVVNLTTAVIGGETISDEEITELFFN